MSLQQYRLTCPCGQSMRVGEDQVGQVGTCIQCGRMLKITQDQLKPIVDPSAPDAVERILEQIASDGVPLDWNPGDVILDLYEVKGQIGVGGMGKVYRVHHRGWGMDLAVKSPRPEMVLRALGVAKFEAECATWINLGLHPHTVTCYYVRRLGGIPRVFAEYVEGGSLLDWLRTRRLYEGGPEAALARILDVAIQFAWGLGYAHERGFVHQDVKPANVLLSQTGQVKVADFGLARAFALDDDENGMATLNRGGMTKAYRSPEQAKHHESTPKSDMWGWGLTVLEMFAGRPNWQSGEEAPRALARYLRKPPPPEEKLPALPAEVAQLLGACFAEAPEARPASMAAIAAQLQSIYRSLTGSAYARPAPKPAEVLADSLNNRAVSLLDLGKRSEATRLWKEALRIDPHHPDSVYNLGLISWRSGRITDDALLLRLDETERSQPAGSSVPYLTAQVHIERGDYTQAANELERLDAHGPVGVDVASARALVNERRSLSRRRLRSLRGHNDTVTCAALCDEPRIALSGSDDNTLRLWNLTTGKEIRRLTGHTNTPRAACMNREGHFAVSGSVDKSVRLWHLASGECLQVCTGHGGTVKAVSLDGEGGWALSGSEDRTLRLWHLDTGDCVQQFEGHEGGVNAVSLSARGRRAASGGADRTVRLWHVRRGECLQVFLGHAGAVNGVALSEDGRWIVSCSEDSTVRLWDVDRGECARTFTGHDGAVLALALSGDARYVISSGQDSTVRLWEVATGRCLFTFRKHEGPVPCVALSRDGRMALSGGRDRLLHLWHAAAYGEAMAAPMQVCRALDSEAATSSGAAFAQALALAREALDRNDALEAAHQIRVARSQPGRRRAPESMAEWRRLYVLLPKRQLTAAWEARNLRSTEEPLKATCLAMNGRRLLASSGQNAIEVWDIPTDSWLCGFGRDVGVAQAVSFSEDGSLAAVGSWGVRLYDARDGGCRRVIEGQSYPVRAVALSPDSRLVLAGSSTGGVRLWDTATGHVLWSIEAHTGEVTALAWNGDGLYALSGGDDQHVFLWDIPRGRVLRAFPSNCGPVTSVAFSRDGRSVLVSTGGQWGGSGEVQLWDAVAGQCVRTFGDNAGAVTSAAFSADGRYIISGGADRAARVWDAVTGECLHTFETQTAPIVSVGLSADGGHAVSADRSGEIKVWTLEWELEDRATGDWDPAADIHLTTFLSRHTPHAKRLAPDRAPTASEVTAALTRQGRPAWTPDDFERLMYDLGTAGYGWLRRDAVLARLNEMASSWSRPPQPYGRMLTAGLSGALAHRLKGLFGR
jgi:WD40 repeat protein/serine/threonine protein kinase